MDKSIKSKDSITLKEASELSGYSQDYIGQLIRMGKLSGKQVYYNVAWVTTKEALDEYIDKAREKKSKGIADHLKRSEYPILKFLQDGRFDKMMRIFMYAGAVLAGFMVLLSLFILSASIENKLERRALNALTIEAIDLHQNEK